MFLSCSRSCCCCCCWGCCCCCCCCCPRGGDEASKLDKLVWPSKSSFNSVFLLDPKRPPRASLPREKIQHKGSYRIFSRGHVTLHLAVSVGRSIRPSVRHIFEVRAFFALLPLPNRPRRWHFVSALSIVVCHSCLCFLGALKLVMVGQLVSYANVQPSNSKVPTIQTSKFTYYCIIQKISGNDLTFYLKKK